MAEVNPLIAAWAFILFSAIGWGGFVVTLMKIKWYKDRYKYWFDRWLNIKEELGIETHHQND